MGAKPTILVLGQAADPTVSAVIAALGTRARVLRLDDNDPLVDMNIRVDDPAASLLLSASGLRITVGDIGAAWLYGGAFTLVLPASIPASARAGHTREWDNVRTLLHRWLGARGGLGPWHQLDALDRVSQLDAARAAGLEVPRTAIVNTSVGRDRFLDVCPGAVTKTLAHGLPGYTRVVAPEEPVRNPRLLQERVPRVADLRVFFVDGALNTMALFPDDPHAVDLRERGLSGARAVPYRLPTTVRAALRQLTERLGFDIGAADLVLTPDDRHVFLEVNPSGRFSADSAVCHAQLEEKVAEALLARTRGERLAETLDTHNAEPCEPPAFQLFADVRVVEGERDDGQVWLHATRAGQRLEIPARLARALAVGVEPELIQAAFGTIGHALAEALVSRGWAQKTTFPERFPRLPDAA